MRPDRFGSVVEDPQESRRGDNLNRGVAGQEYDLERQEVAAIVAYDLVCQSFDGTGNNRVVLGIP